MVLELGLVAIFLPSCFRMHENLCCHCGTEVLAFVDSCSPSLEELSAGSWSLISSGYRLVSLSAIEECVKNKPNPESL